MTVLENNARGPFTSIVSALALMLTTAMSTACTGDKGAPSVVTPSAISPMTAAKNTVARTTCTPEQLAAFDQPVGQPVDLDVEPLASGLYLAVDSMMLVEAKAEGGVARALVREVPGSKSAVIACLENPERFGNGFEVALSGLVKFDTSKSAGGTGLSVRQYYFFSGADGVGAVLSNPRMGSRAVDLKSLLKSGPAIQLLRIGERSYMLKYLRERPGTRARLLIRLEQV